MKRLSALVFGVISMVASLHTTASASIYSAQRSILMVVSGYGKGQGEEARNNPNLDIQIATTQQQLGDTLASQQTAEKILSQHHDFTPAKELLESLTQ